MRGRHVYGAAIYELVEAGGAALVVREFQRYRGVSAAAKYRARRAGAGVA
jgi:uncharacterized membrane protein